MGVGGRLAYLRADACAVRTGFVHKRTSDPTTVSRPWRQVPNPVSSLLLTEGSGVEVPHVVDRLGLRPITELAGYANTL